MNLFFSLTINGLATGFLIFLLAAGLSLIFGLMGVLNFAHGGLFAWGAYMGTWGYLAGGHFILGLFIGFLTGIFFGYLMEKWIIAPVYGNHVQQILITLGTMILLGELIKLFFGANPVRALIPDWLAGSFTFGGIVMIKYRLFIILMGVILLALLHFFIMGTRWGLVIRAGVMNKEMVETLGYNVRLMFLLVFLLGAGLAGLAGVMIGPYVGVFTPEIGMEYQLLAFVVVVIGGMGQILGTASASLLVGLANAYIAYFFPDISMAVNMLLMILILTLRPQGLFGTKERY
ncbi:branched-chain amino acid ABC transporter permease [Thermicanus aegyptius]|uniref:branched-chain amino acid ABC transporter permease n=1 Tax=Thermicanus aegyptius TaxID=94009 RepID=UPI0003FA2559|nr:branched-chain amino acid ABC transporter permease [Thermicanus aegyptius]